LDGSGFGRDEGHSTSALDWHVELLRASQTIITRLQEPMLILAIAGLIYFLMSYPLARLWGAPRREVANTMIEIKNVHKSFGELEVIKGVSLTVSKGEVVSIIGGQDRENRLC
jgi:ABC-type multidrug transport system fused ATPase/permease subunit